MLFDHSFSLFTCGRRPFFHERRDTSLSNIFDYVTIVWIVTIFESQLWYSFVARAESAALILQACQLGEFQNDWEFTCYMKAAKLVWTFTLQKRISSQHPSEVWIQTHGVKAGCMRPTMTTTNWTFVRCFLQSTILSNGCPTETSMFVPKLRLKV